MMPIAETVSLSPPLRPWGSEERFLSLSRFKVWLLRNEVTNASHNAFFTTALKFFLFCPVSRTDVDGTCIDEKWYIDHYARYWERGETLGPLSQIPHKSTSGYVIFEKPGFKTAMWFRNTYFHALVVTPLSDLQNCLLTSFVNFTQLFLLCFLASCYPQDFTSTLHLFVLYGFHSVKMTFIVTKIAITSTSNVELEDV